VQVEVNPHPQPFKVDSNIDTGQDEVIVTSSKSGNSPTVSGKGNSVTTTGNSLKVPGSRSGVTTTSGSSLRVPGMGSRGNTCSDTSGEIAVETSSGSGRGSGSQRTVGLDDSDVILTDDGSSV
jgi:hypothetical protein